MRAETPLEKKISGIFRFKSARREEKANKSDVHRELQVVCLHVTSGGGASSSSDVSMLLLFSS